MKSSLPSSKRCSSTTKAAIFSHLPSVSSGGAEPGCFFNASLTAAIARSRRCLVVMHSLLRTIAEGLVMSGNTVSTTSDLPVDSTPWTIKVWGIHGVD